jgi:hypothetical protein
LHQDAPSPISVHQTVASTFSLLYSYENNHKKHPIPLQETSSCQQALAAIQRQAQVERQFFLSPLPQQNLTPKRYQLFSSNISKMIKRWQILFKMHGSKSMLLVRKPNRSPG